MPFRFKIDDPIDSIIFFYRPNNGGKYFMIGSFDVSRNCIAFGIGQQVFVQLSES